MLTGVDVKQAASVLGIGESAVLRHIRGCYQCGYHCREIFKPAYRKELARGKRWCQG